LTVVTVKPTYAQVFINGTQVTPSDIIQCRVTLSCDNKAGDCDIILNDSQGTYDGLYYGSQSIQIYLYKSGGTPSLQWSGVVDDIKTMHTMKHYCTMDIHGVDKSWVMMNRLVSAVYQTIDLVNNPGPSLDSVVIDLVTNPSNLVDTYQTIYDFGALPITAANPPAGYVQKSPIYVQNLTFYNQAVNDCLQQLANIGLANWYVDVNGALHFFIISNSGTQGQWSSQQIIDESLMNDMTIEDIYSGIYNLVAVTGGSYDQVDQHNENYSSGFINTQNQYTAIKFTAGQVAVDNIAFYGYMIQSNPLVPVTQISGAIVGDNGGVPANNQLWAQWNANYSQFPNGAANATWVTIPCSANISPGQDYWIIIYKTPSNPAEPSDGFYIGEGGSESYATSPDGQAWTAGTGPGIAFRTYYQSQILAMPADLTSASKYQPRETVITDTSIALPKWAMIVAQGYLNILAKPKRILTIDSVAPDIFIQPGQSVKVINADRGINGWFQCLDITYNIEDVSCYQANYTMAAYVD
jgi:hypothetical protein